MAKTTSDIILERLLEWGIDTYYGLPGDGINGYFESTRQHRDQIRYVHCCHEEAASLAAVGHAEFTGKPAVCISTAGPGAVHMLNGMYDAKMEQAPLIAITGMTYHEVIGTHFLQDINQERAFEDACYFNQRVMGPAHARNIADLAGRTAFANRGPSHIFIPIDIQSFEFSEDELSDKNMPQHTTLAPQPRIEDPPREELESLSECREKLEEAFSHDGPALIDCVVDQNESAFAETLKPQQAENIATGFERGEGECERMRSNLLREELVEVSPGLQYAKEDLESAGR